MRCRLPVSEVWTQSGEEGSAAAATGRQVWDIPVGRRRDWVRPATPTPVVRGAAYILSLMSGLVDQPKQQVTRSEGREPGVSAVWCWL